MNDVLSISPKNSYLTSKQWETVVDYVKNKKIALDEIVEEPNETIEKDFTAYEMMVVATSVEEMYGTMLAIMNKSPNKLYAMTSGEVQNLYNIATQMNEREASDDYQDLADTLQYLVGEYDLNDAITYATWDGSSASGTYTISGTITMSSAINITSGKTLTLTGSGRIKRGSGSAYFYVQDGGTLVIKGTNNDSNIIIDGDNIASSNAAIRVNKNLTLDYVTIQNCNRTSGMGGAIQFGYDGYTKTVSSTITNSVINNCKAPEGSAIIFHNSCGGQITISNTAISNCESTGTYGGTVRTQGSANCKVTIESCNISNNISNRHGGGVYWNARGTNASLAIIGTENNPTIISNNTASERGGGVYIGGQSINITYTNINNNTSHNGGGICMSPYDYSTTTGSGCTLTLGKGAKILNNTATEYGGGVYMDIYSASASMGENFTVTVNDEATIQGNVAEYGGAFALTQKLGGAENSSNNNKKYNAYVNINGGIIGGITESTMNKANINGGAFYVSREYGDGGNDYDLKIDILGGNILGNKAVQNGGAIYLSDNAQNSKAQVNVNGGNIGSADTDIGNTAINGGAVYVNNGSVSMSGGVIISNKATNNGGAVCVTDGNFTMNGGKLQNNVSEISGGAIYITNGDVNLDSGTIYSNIALVNGGALAVKSGNVTIGTKECYDAGVSSTHIHPVIESNIASDGGGVHVDGGTTIMWCGDIRHNHTYDKTVNVLVVNGNFTYNGGAIGVPYDSGIFVTGGIFEDNTSEVYGDIKHELCYHSVLSDVTYNGKIPESKWIASPRGDILHKEDCDDTSPTWQDLFPKYEFVGWGNQEETNTNEVVNLYAIWEEK